MASPTIDNQSHSMNKTELLDILEPGFREIKTGIENFKTDIQENRNQINLLEQDVRNLRRAGIHRGTITKPGEVSDECARFLFGCYVVAAQRQGKLDSFNSRNKDALLSIGRDGLGMEAKTALTTSDIPLPTQWGSEVVELVSQYGFARRLGTVFPLGASSVKLPRLGTDPVFGLLTMSGAVTEKSPTIVFVTFDPAKWGGLIRLPSEIDEDSAVSMGKFIARYAARQLAKLEDTVYWAGDGTGTYNSLKGLTYSTIDNSKVVQMASTKTHYSDATLANIRAIRAVVDAPALAVGRYYMHPSFEQHMANLNTAGDKPYTANGLNGQTFDGFPISWVDVMPAYSTSANVSKVFMLFGDATYQYLGVRGQIRFDTSIDAAFTTDEILIRAIERFTIGLMATGAVAGLQTAAS
jgi:HK97 family phage major capsid protein